MTTRTHSTLTHRRHRKGLHDYALLFAERGNNLHYGPHVYTLHETDANALPYAGDLLPQLRPIAWDLWGAPHLVGPEAEEDYFDDILNPCNIVDTAGAWDSDEFCSRVWEDLELSGVLTCEGAVILDRHAVTLDYTYDPEG